MSDTLYENYNTGDDDSKGFYGVYWKGQTFTPAVTHTITSVKLKLGRYVGLTGSMTVSIRATSGGVPTGADLCSGTYDANSVPTTAAFVEITLGAGTLLTAGVMYAICYRYTTGDATHYIFARGDGSSPAYSGGTYVSSANSGSTWGTEAWDAMFEEYGIPSGTLYQATHTGAITPSGTLTKKIKQNLLGSITPSGVLNKLVKRIHTGAFIATGELKKTIRQILTGAITFIGEFTGNIVSTQTLSTDLWHLRFDQILSTDLWKITFTTIPVVPSSYALYKIVAVTIKCGTAIIDTLKLRRIQ